MSRVCAKSEPEQRGKEQKRTTTTCKILVDEGSSLPNTFYLPSEEVI
jgi:hypothetical protein